MKYFGLTETKLLHFHGIFENGQGGGERSPEPPLDLPLCPMGIELQYLDQTSVPFPNSSKSPDVDTKARLSIHCSSIAISTTSK